MILGEKIRFQSLKRRCWKVIPSESVKWDINRERQMNNSQSRRYQRVEKQRKTKEIFSSAGSFRRISMCFQKFSTGFSTGYGKLTEKWEVFKFVRKISSNLSPEGTFTRFTKTCGFRGKAMHHHYFPPVGATPCGSPRVWRMFFAILYGLTRSWKFYRRGGNRRLTTCYALRISISALKRVPFVIRNGYAPSLYI